MLNGLFKTFVTNMFSFESIDMRVQAEAATIGIL